MLELVSLIALGVQLFQTRHELDVIDENRKRERKAARFREASRFAEMREALEDQKLAAISQGVVPGSGSGAIISGRRVSEYHRAQQFDEFQTDARMDTLSNQKTSAILGGVAGTADVFLGYAKAKHEGSTGEIDRRTTAKKPTRRKRTFGQGAGLAPYGNMEQSR